jgi:hypothetical protein
MCIHIYGWGLAFKDTQQVNIISFIGSCGENVFICLLLDNFSLMKTFTLPLFPYESVYIKGKIDESVYIA